MANSVDPDQTAPDLSLHGLYMSVCQILKFRNFRTLPYQFKKASQKEFLWIWWLISQIAVVQFYYCKFCNLFQQIKTKCFLCTFFNISASARQNLK